VSDLPGPPIPPFFHPSLPPLRQRLFLATDNLLAISRLFRLRSSSIGPFLRGNFPVANPFEYRALIFSPGPPQFPSADSMDFPRGKPLLFDRKWYPLLRSVLFLGFLGMKVSSFPFGFFLPRDTIPFAFASFLDAVVFPSNVEFFLQRQAEPAVGHRSPPPTQIPYASITPLPGPL